MPKGQDRAFAGYRDPKSPTWSLQHQAGATIALYVLYYFVYAFFGLMFKPLGTEFPRFLYIHVVIKPEFSKFPKKIKVWSLSSSRCKFSVSVDFVSQKKSRQKVFMSFIEDSTAKFTDDEVHLRDATKLLSVEKDRSF